MEKVFIFILFAGVEPLPTSSNKSFVNLADTECGQWGASRDGKVIGGRDAKEGEFPWSVSLQSGHTHFCGGIIISPTHILTAAHCFIFYIYGVMGEESLREIEIIAGSVDITGGGAQTRKLKRLKLHPQFSHFYPDFHNDIALIEIDLKWEWGQHVQPACLSNKPPGKEKGSEGWVAGWGVESLEEEEEGFNIERKLKTLALPLWTNSKCEEAYRSKGIQWVAKSSHLCAGDFKGAKDTCRVSHLKKNQQWKFYF
jgi:hypothetical protein